MIEATRATFGKTIAEIGNVNENVVVLEADLGKSTHSFLFKNLYPKRYFQMGIAEANMIGTAAGMAFAGKIPIICSFACFVTGRYDIIRISIAYPRANVKIIGTHSGIGAGEDGTSQQGLEDISIMRALPNMSVMQPCDKIEARKMIEFALDFDGPMYLRLTRQKVENIHDESYEFRYGKADLIKDGSDIVLISSGATVFNTLKAAKLLEKENVSAAVINIHTIKPIDREMIYDFADKVKFFITIEDHNTIGGLGSAVADVLAGKLNNCVLKKVGLQDCFGESGNPDDLYEKYRLSDSLILETALDFIRNT